jgi:hypothetical protein
MKTFRFFDSAVVALVSLGILMPAPQASAAQPVPSVTVVNRAAADVALTPQGEAGSDCSPGKHRGGPRDHE